MRNSNTFYISLIKEMGYIESNLLLTSLAIKPLSPISLMHSRHFSPTCKRFILQSIIFVAWCWKLMYFSSAVNIRKKYTSEILYLYNIYFLVSPLGDTPRYLLSTMDESTLLMTFHCYILYQLWLLPELNKYAKFPTLTLLLFPLACIVRAEIYMYIL